MPIEFRCSQCSKLLRVGDEMSDRRVLCPECSTVLVVPAPAAAAPGEDSPPGPTEDSPFSPGQTGPSWQPQAENPYQSPQAVYGAPSAASRHAQRRVDNYLVQAILCLLCCCWPFAIPAIVYAAQVNGHLGAGNYAAARTASDNAKMWCWVSFTLGLIGNALVLGFYMMAATQGGRF